MRTRNFIAVVTIGLIFVVVGCSDRRPKIAGAKADFSQLYPIAGIVSIRVTETKLSHGVLRSHIAIQASRRRRH